MRPFQVLSIAVAVACVAGVSARWLPGAGGSFAQTALAEDTNADRAGLDAPRIAVCAIPSLVNDLLASDRYAPAREEYMKELQEELADLEEEWNDLREEAAGADPESPEGKELFEKWRDLQRRVGEKQGEIRQKLEAQQAEQFVDAYALARTSAQAIAEDLGFNYVFASMSEDEELVRTSLGTANRQMLARPAILWPDGADITDDVRDDLHLE